MSKDLAESSNNDGFAKSKIIETLNEIEASILHTRQEILPLSENHGLNHPSFKALDELDLVLDSTENATQIILRAAEKIENLASWTDASTASEISQIVTQIYEACNFQDLAGQRIAKVICTFRDIELKVQFMIQALGGTSGLSKEHIQQAFNKKRSENNDVLPNFQRKKEGKIQDEIDNLFD